MATSGIGIVFNIDDLGGGFYGDKAWRIFMSALKPTAIVGCTLHEGDTNETLGGRRREFCIAVLGTGLDLSLVRKTFENCSDKGLAPPARRFVEDSRLASEPLVDSGRIDVAGRLVQDEWSRVVHDQCKDCGWGFAPRKITVNLSPDLKTELKALQDKTVSGSAPTAQPMATVSPRQVSKPWWKFWV